MSLSLCGLLEAFLNILCSLLRSRLLLQMHSRRWQVFATFVKIQSKGFTAVQQITSDTLKYNKSFLFYLVVINNSSILPFEKSHAIGKQSQPILFSLSGDDFLSFDDRQPSTESELDRYLNSIQIELIHLKKLNLNRELIQC